MINKIKFKKKTIGVCHGVFDVLHFGHINYLKAAKNFVDILIVTVTSDKFVDKGPGRPIFKIKDRIKVLKELSCIDYVFESNSYTAKDIILKFKPDYYFKGIEYTKDKIKTDLNLKEELSALKKVKGKFKIIDKETYSSSKISNKYKGEFNNLSLETQNFLNRTSKKNKYKTILEDLKKIKNVKVLIIGELIIDQYIEAEPIGKSGKENFLVHKKMKDLSFLGGTGYLANLISNFSNNVELVSFIGEKKDKLGFIKKICQKIKFKFFTKNNSTTFTKLRYLDNYRKIKFNGIYDINDDLISNTENQQFLNYLKKVVNKYDLILLADYGHGILTDEFRKFINKNDEKLYANIQINSFNRHFQSILKYKKLNTLVINETEIRSEFRSRKLSLDNLANQLSRKIKFKNLVITRGNLGSVFIIKNPENYIKYYAQHLQQAH